MRHCSAAVAVAAAHALVACAAAQEGPWLPTRFSATIRTTAHLVDPGEEYPPREGTYKVAYDLDQRRALVVAEAGIYAGQTHYKLYGDKKEYVLRAGEFASCKRSYLGETMTAPSLPALQLLDEAAVEEDIAYAMEPLIRKDLTQYIHRAGLDSMLLFQARPEDSMAVMVSELYRNVDTQEWDPLMTWELEDVQLQAPADAVFSLPVDHAACERDLTGTPYLHLFHAILRV